MTSSELEDALSGMGRPSIGSITEHLRGMPESGVRLKAAQKAWDEADPERHAKYAAMTKLAVEAEAAEERAAKEAAESKRIYATVLAIAGGRVVESLKNINSTKMLTEAIEWWQGGDWCLVMTGGTGSGKTTAAAWLVLQHTNRPVGFYRSGEKSPNSVVWLNAAEASMQSIYGDEAMARARDCQTTALLVIDDLGSDMQTAPWKSWLEAILSARHAFKRRTVITTNLAPEALKVRLEERLYDRVREGRVVATTDASMRRRPTQ